MDLDIDLASLDDGDANELVTRLLWQLETAHREVERSGRRVAGIRKVIDGLVEMFPATEDLLPEDFDPNENPRPRGATAVQLALATSPGHWFTVVAIKDMLEHLGWVPKSSNPTNAVRSALERLIESGQIEKGRSDKGFVVYRAPAASSLSYDYGEEPF